MIKNFFPLVLIFCISISAYGQAGGPVQQEYVAPNYPGNGIRVNQFDGSMSYSIPVLSVPGSPAGKYTMYLSYDSRIRPNDPATWVGFGWNLTFGSINRQISGIPDDHEQVTITYYAKSRPNISVSTITGTGYEINGLGVDGSTFYSYNTLTGYGMRRDLGAKVGLESIINYVQEIRDALGDYADDIRGDLINIGLSNSPGEDIIYDIKFGMSSWAEIAGLGVELFGSNVSPVISNQLIRMSSAYLPGSYATGTGAGNFMLPQIAERFSGGVFNSSFTLRKQEFQREYLKSTVPLLSMSYTEVTTPGKYDATGRGFMFTGDQYWNSEVMDYGTEKSLGFTMADKNLPVILPGKDKFIISGHGVGGSFEFKPLGVLRFRPDEVISKIDLDPLSLGAGTGVNGQGSYISVSASVGNGHHKSGMMGGSDLKEVPAPLGVDIYPLHSSSSISESWISNGTANPSELSNHLKTNQDIIETSVNISYSKFSDIINGESLNSLTIDQDQIEKLTGIDDSAIMSITVTGADGIKYVYGMPVFSRKNTQVTFGINKLNGLSNNYTNDNILAFAEKSIEKAQPDNPDVKETVAGVETNEPYVVTYLLTAVLSPDYSDLTRDGPTQDDLGTYLKATYKTVLGSNDKNSRKKWFKWRFPYSGLYYDRASLSDDKDDIGSVTYGERELVYLETIETKTHKAVFVTNDSEITLRKKISEHDLANIEPIIPNPVGEIRDIVISGSGTERKDAFPAYSDENKASSRFYGPGFSQQHTEMDAEGNTTSTDYVYDDSSVRNPSQMLERIELYKISFDAGPILESKLSTTYFRYDSTYSIWPGQPNSKLYCLPKDTLNSPPYHTHNNICKEDTTFGKLTLKEIWTDAGNAKEHFVSPYKFEYKYPENFIQPLGYPNLTFDSNLEEEPYYNPLNIDSWGYYEEDDVSFIGEKYKDKKDLGFLNKTDSRKYNLKPWSRQVQPLNYDPAAWLLKEITSPNGLKTFVQYEKHDYAFVQDRPVMIPVPIKTIEDHGGGKRIVLDFDDYGFTDQEIIDIESYLSSYTEDKDQYNYIYANLVYSLAEEMPQSLFSFSDCSAESIESYMPLSSSSSIYDGSKQILRLDFDNFIAKNLCDDILYSQRWLRYINGTSNCDPCSGGINIEYDWGDFDQMASKVFELVLLGGNTDYGCSVIDLKHSFVRIPLPPTIERKAGGVRVKQVFSINDTYAANGIGNEKVSGTEYIYKAYAPDYEQYISSGVAVNEPRNLAKYNSLVYFLQNRSIQERNPSPSTFTNRQQVRKKLNQLIGPYGASLLPESAICYSDVITRPIVASGSNDLSQTSFLNHISYITPKDFPYDFKVINSELDLSVPAFYSTPIKKKLDDGGRSKIKLEYDSDAEAYQKYLFFNTGISGRIKASSLYKGDFSQLHPIKKENIVSKTTYQYYGYDYERGVFDFSDKPELFDGQSIQEKWPGIKTERYRENRTSFQEMEQWSVSGDISVLYSPVIKINDGGASYIPFRDRVTSRSTTDVTFVSLPVIVKGIESINDGISNLEDFLAHDPNTHQPLITRSYGSNEGMDNGTLDPVNDSYYSVSFKAYQEYSGMGSKGIGYSDEINHKNRITQVKDGINSKLIFERQQSINGISEFRQAPCESTNGITKGDVIKIKPIFMGNTPENHSQSELYEVESVDCYIVNLKSVLTYGSKSASIEVEILKIDDTNTNQLTPNAGKLVLHGTENVPISNDIRPYQQSKKWLQRSSLASILSEEYLHSLDNSISSKTIDFSTYTNSQFGINTPQDWELEFISNDGLCYPVNDLQIKIELQDPITEPSYYIEWYQDQNGDWLYRPLYCDTAKTQIAYTDYDYRTLKLSVLKNPGTSVVLDNTTHPLVEDLNRWLDRVWQKRLSALEKVLSPNVTNLIQEGGYPSTGFGVYSWTDIGKSEETDYNKFPNSISALYKIIDDSYPEIINNPSNKELQAYIRDELNSVPNLNPFLRSGSISKILYNWTYAEDYLNKESGLDFILNKYYMVDGQKVKGSDLFNPENGNEDLKVLYSYSSLGEEPVASDILIGKSKIKIKYNDLTALGIDISAKHINAENYWAGCDRTYTIPPDDIFQLTGQSIPHDEANLSGYNLTSDKYTLASDQFLKDMTGSVFTETFGKFEVQNGYLTFVPEIAIAKIYSFDDIGSPIPLFRLYEQDSIEIEEVVCYQAYPVSRLEVLEQNGNTYCQQNVGGFWRDEDGIINFGQNRTVNPLVQDPNIPWLLNSGSSSKMTTSTLAATSDYLPDNTFINEAGFQCVQFCDEPEYYVAAENVLYASATSYQKAAGVPGIADASHKSMINNTPLQITEAARTIFRPKSSYSYSVDRTRANDYDDISGQISHAAVTGNYDNNLMQEIGRLDGSGFFMFNWREPENYNSGSELLATRWIENSTIEEYDLDGVPRSTKNFLDNYSSVRRSRYDYNTISIIAQNAHQSEVFFDDFEYDDPSYDPAFAHTGKSSYKISSAGGTYSTGNTVLRLKQEREQVNDTKLPEGLIISFWLKQSYNNIAISTLELPTPTFTIKIDYSGATQDYTLTNKPQKVAQTGAWSLYEVTTDLQPEMSQEDFGVTLMASLAGEELWIDDFRAIPLRSTVKANVFDPSTGQIVATLGDNHLATIVGRNIVNVPKRIRSETTSGIRTIADNDANIPKMKRSLKGGGALRTVYNSGGGQSLIRQSKSGPTDKRFDYNDLFEDEERVVEKKSDTYSSRFIAMPLSQVDTIAKSPIEVQMDLIKLKLGSGVSELELLQGIFDSDIDDINIKRQLISNQKRIIDSLEYIRVVKEKGIESRIDKSIEIPSLPSQIPDASGVRIPKPLAPLDTIISPKSLPDSLIKKPLRRNGLEKEVRKEVRK